MKKVESPQDYLILTMARFDDTYGGFDAEAIMVEVSPSFAKEMLDKMALARGLSSLDPSITFVGVRDETSFFLKDVDEAVKEEMEGDGGTHYAMSRTGTPPGENVGVQYLEIRVREDTLCWHGMPGHHNLLMESAIVTREELREIAKKA